MARHHLGLGAMQDRSTYFIDGPTWHLLFLVLAWLSVLYSGTAYQDLIDAYGWLFKDFQ